MKWNTSLYDVKHDFVSKYGADLIELLAPQEGESILDLGCGTGDLAAAISEKGAHVRGMDSSVEMIEAAREKYPALAFDVARAEDFGYAEKFDAVFSNATLHWVLQYKDAVQCIYEALRPGGRFVAEFGGKGNVAGIIAALKKALEKNGYAPTAAKAVWYFPSLAEYTKVLEEAGFRVVFAAHFDRPTLLKDSDGARNWLRMFGWSYLEELEEESVEAVLNDVEDQIRASHLREGKWYADYVRLRVMAIKP